MDLRPKIAIRKPAEGDELCGPGDPSNRHAALDIVKGTRKVVTVTLVPEGRSHPDIEIRALVASKGGTSLAGRFLPRVTFNTPFVIPAGADSGLLSITSSPALPPGKYLAVLLASPAGVANAPATMELFDLTVQPA